MTQSGRTASTHFFRFSSKNYALQPPKQQPQRNSASEYILKGIQPQNKSSAANTAGASAASTDSAVLTMLSNTASDKFSLRGIQPQNKSSAANTAEREPRQPQQTQQY